MKYPLVSRLLRRNTSAARIAGFILSNFLGLTIVAGALQFYFDARTLWTEEDSFVRSDHMVINKRVSSGNTLDMKANDFTAEEIEEIKEQPWVRSVGKFRKADFRVHASIGFADITRNAAAGEEQSGRSGQLSTAMFLEAVPDSFLDIPLADWQWTPDSPEVPIVISKDYLALYNFGFAAGSGLPQLSASTVSGIPLTLELYSEDGSQHLVLPGRVAGYSRRFNTILAPESFIEYMNTRLAENGGDNGGKKDGDNSSQSPSRIIIDVSSPGDAAIAPWLEEHGYEVAGDKTASSAAYLLRIIVTIVVAIGSVISLLSLFILMLSISLLMEKNRSKLHSLLMLGYNPADVARPYWNIITVACCGAALLSAAAIAVLRAFYLSPLEGLGAESGSFFTTILTLLIMTVLIISLNFLSVYRRVISTWR